MKKITCIQNYVIDKLIEDEKWICGILRVVLLVCLYVNIDILVALIRQPSRGECVK